MVSSEPMSAGICSTLSFSPATTLYCLPPVFMTAYMIETSSNVKKNSSPALSNELNRNGGTADYTWMGISRQKLFTSAGCRGMSATLHARETWLICHPCCHRGQTMPPGGGP